MAVERHGYLPGARVSFRVLNSGFVLNDFAAQGRVAFHNVELISVEVTGAGEPCGVVETLYVDDERGAVPAAVGVAHPRVGRAVSGAGLDRNEAGGAGELVGDEDGAGRLHDLERIRHVSGAGHAGKEAFHFGIGGEPVGAALLLLSGGGGGGGDFVTLHNTEPGRLRAGGTEGEDRTLRRGMGEEIPVGGIERLPDAVEV